MGRIMLVLSAGTATHTTRKNCASKESRCNSGWVTTGVDLYIGGAEHAVLHLLYARFWHKVLFDLGYVPTKEPVQRLFHQGMILGEDNRKMSKSLGNVLNPDDVVAEIGADAVRLYEMFMGPLEASSRGIPRGLKAFHASSIEYGDWSSPMTAVCVPRSRTRNRRRSRIESCMQPSRRPEKMSTR